MATESPAQRHSPTSKRAAKGVDTSRLRRIVFQAIYKACGLTDQEGQRLTGLSGDTYRPRRIELVRAKRVKDSGKTRLTKSGKPAVVWVVG